MEGFEIVLLFSIALSIVISIAYRLLIKPSEIKKIKAEAKFHQDKASKARKSGDAEGAQKHQMEALKVTQKQTGLMMKPMIVSFILFIVFVGYVGAQYADLEVLTPTRVPLLGWDFPYVYLAQSLNWFWWYIVITIPGTMFFRKLLGVE
ncbi:MAG: EMC3/TMCO1 family protein [Candidatus Aenigmatarchaeota archaeon]